MNAILCCKKFQLHFGSMCKHGQVYQKNPWHKKLQVDKSFFYALKVEILFYSVINMKINFHFTNINLKDEHFHVYFNRFYKIAIVQSYKMGCK
jgi:hypothetical protein